jgi:hypothetical protein
VVAAAVVENERLTSDKFFLETLKYLVPEYNPNNAKIWFIIVNPAISS